MAMTPSPKLRDPKVLALMRKIIVHPAFDGFSGAPPVRDVRQAVVGRLARLRRSRSPTSRARVAAQADADKTFNDEVAKWGKMVQALNLSIHSREPEVRTISRRA
jgi:hypothetical protein